MKKKEADQLKKEILDLDLSGAISHIIVSLIISLFLGAIYYFYKWKIIGVFLIFFIGYCLLGIVIVSVGLFVKWWGLKKIKEKEDQSKKDDFNF